MTMNHTGAFFGEASLKASVLAKIAEHRRLNQLEQGATGAGGKGCAVVCTIGTYSHEAYANALNMPLAIPYLDEHIFEAATHEFAMTWPTRFIAAIPIGADLGMVLPRFLLTVLRRLQPQSSGQQYGLPEALQQTMDVYQSWIDTGQVDVSAARSAECAARSAAWSAARSAAWSAESATWSAAESAECAAWSAARSAECAARSAAWSAARSAAWSAECAAWSAAESAESATWSAESARSAAWSAEIEWQAEALLHILRTSPCMDHSSRDEPNREIPSIDRSIITQEIHS